MFSDWNLSLFLPGLILLIASIDDLRSRKIHNKLILFLLPFVLLGVLFLKGFSALFGGFFSAFLAVLVGVPMTMGRIIGGGDLKLLVLVAFTLEWPDFFWIVICSLPWALLLGIFKILLEGKIKDFFSNLLLLLKLRTAKDLQFHSIPFSVALFTAWLSFMTLQRLSF